MSLTPKKYTIFIAPKLPELLPKPVSSNIKITGYFLFREDIIYKYYIKNNFKSYDEMLKFFRANPSEWKNILSDSGLKWLDLKREDNDEYKYYIDLAKKYKLKSIDSGDKKNRSKRKRMNRSKSRIMRRKKSKSKSRMKKSKSKSRKRKNRSKRKTRLRTSN
jgi:hypothetical protein